MSIQNPTNGRTRQKARTRREIIEAAQRLRERSDGFTLEQVAEEAEMSRATVYRYFSSVSALQLEIGLAVQLKAPHELFDEEEHDPLARMLRVHEHVFELLQKNEAEFRAYLKSTLEQWEKRGDRGQEPLRGARRVALVEAALAELESKLAADDYRRLVQSISLLTFMEPFLVLKDVFQVEGEEADDVVRWAITHLLRGVTPPE